MIPDGSTASRPSRGKVACRPGHIGPSRDKRSHDSYRTGQPIGAPDLAVAARRLGIWLKPAAQLC
jgi:hypothetical protein